MILQKDNTEADIDRHIKDMFWVDIPEHMRSGFAAYFKNGQAGGSFQQAVLGNDLIHAFETADRINTLHLRDYAAFLVNNAPTGSYGSKKNVDGWEKLGGLMGMLNNIKAE